MCDEFARNDSRVKVIHQKNGGAGVSRNTGLDVARGELIGTVDSDDFILPEMYSKLYAIMRDNDADISMCGYVYADEAGNVLDNIKVKPRIDETITGEEGMRRYFTGYGDYCLTWEKLHKAEIFRDIRFPAGNRHDDLATIHRRFGASKLVAITGETFYMYCQRDESVMDNIRKYEKLKKFNLKYFQDIEYIYWEWVAYFESRKMREMYEFAFLRTYYLMGGTLHDVNCLQYRKEILPYFFLTMKKLIFSKSFKNKLRAVKLALKFVRSLFRPFQKQ